MIPKKPFSSFKWRWLHVQPTESLLDPPVFLGVLRVLAKFEGTAPGNENVRKALGVVAQETKSHVDLERTAERNLIRNSGQYWKGTGLLQPSRKNITLTDFGKRVASGAISQNEFASIMVQQTVLPNPYTYSADEIEKWNSAGLQIKPLMLILEIIDKIGIEHGKKEAYLTPSELMKITIPLSGVFADLKTHVHSLHSYRYGLLDITNWPDCTPKANDKRLAREFLLFLANYGLCTIIEEGKTVYDYRFCLPELFEEQVISSISTENIFDPTANISKLVASIRDSGLPSIIERQRTTTTIITRPDQIKFRRNILTAYNKCCLLTGERIQETLEAAHIIPVQHGGSDEPDNGICLRVDIHRLFDSGNIVIFPSGKIRLSDSMKQSANYKRLPGHISIPGFIKTSNLEWRVKYY